MPVGRTSCGGRPSSSVRNKSASRANAPKERSRTAIRVEDGIESESAPQGTEKGVFCMKDFLESIPDYNDINHLSEGDFYGKLDVLKRKHALLKDACFRRTNYDSTASVCVRDDVDDDATPSLSDACSKQHMKRRSHSADSCRLVPSPFQMTKREEEQRMLRELIDASRCAFGSDTDTGKKSSPTKKNETSRKTHRIPASSKYPMYDQIIADQEKRSQLVKLNSMLELQSKIKPFRFATDKSASAENVGHEHGRHQYHPTPDPFASRSLTPPPPPTTTTTKSRGFRARPCPRKMFSNYFYHKMWEDEQFRALNRRLRADEMLQMSATPPSMRSAAGKRAGSSSVFHTQCSPPAVAPDRSQSVASSQRTSRKRGKRRSTRTPPSAGGAARSEFITTCTHPFRFETSRRSVERKMFAAAVAESKAASRTPTTATSTTLTSAQLPAVYSTARPNLAANLRAEWSRKKICELTCGAAERAAAGERRNGRQAWGVRKMPGWKSLYYDHTNDEDISLRLCTRRAEERARHEQHEIEMELMRQRVRATPLLLEGAPLLPTPTTAGAHRYRCDRNPPASVRPDARRRRRASSLSSSECQRGRCSVSGKSDDDAD